MEIILSGYGKIPQYTLAYYRFDHELNYRKEWQAKIENASFVCQGDGYLFTITEADEYAVIYSYLREGNQYKLIDQKKLDGGALCHIMYSSKNKALFGACYGTGTIFSIRVNEGRFEEILYFEKQISDDNKELTRAHSVLLNSDETRLIVANIALDLIYIYDIHKGILRLSNKIAMPKGVGPRHTLLSTDDTLLYIITEYSNEIFVYRNLPNQGYQLQQRISTLPDQFCGVSNCSTLCFSKNGTYLYAANRGADTIALFRVNEEGELCYVQDFSCEGRHPRHMIITSDGNYLIVCNQYSDEVAMFTLNQEKGLPLGNVVTISFPTPSGVIEV